MDEQEAIALLKNENLAGLEFLIQQYQVKAVHTAYLITGDVSTAEDVVQSAFLKVSQKIHQFDDQRPFPPWFLRIVVNGAVKQVKSQQRSLPLEEPDEGVREWLVDAGPKPEELAERTDLRQVVWNAIQQLPPEHRAVIVQRHFLEMSEAEMAEEHQRPSSTIKWWLHTARKRLRTLLDHHDREFEGDDHER